MMKALAPGSPIFLTADAHFLVSRPDMSDAVGTLDSLPPRKHRRFPSRLLNRWHKRLRTLHPAGSHMTHLQLKNTDDGQISNSTLEMAANPRGEAGAQEGAQSCTIQRINESRAQKKALCVCARVCARVCLCVTGLRFKSRMRVPTHGDQ